jgi:hypothetical protein
MNYAETKETACICERAGLDENRPVKLDEITD